MFSLERPVVIILVPRRWLATRLLDEGLVVIQTNALDSHEIRSDLGESLCKDEAPRSFSTHWSPGQTLRCSRRCAPACLVSSPPHQRCWSRADGTLALPLQKRCRGGEYVHRVDRPHSDPSESDISLNGHASAQGAWLLRSVLMMCEEIGRLNINNTGKKSKAAFRL